MSVQSRAFDLFYTLRQVLIFVPSPCVYNSSCNHHFSIFISHPFTCTACTKKTDNVFITFESEFYPDAVTFWEILTDYTSQ